MSSSSSVPTTTLAERIARLNKPSPASASTPSTSTPASTGAQTSVSDKIRRFQTTGDSPLVPVGSFGLGGVRREPSASSPADKGRVASLGLGRAAVPLGVVKASAPRSVSVGADPSRTPEKALPQPATKGVPNQEVEAPQPPASVEAAPPRQPEVVVDEPSTPPLLSSQLDTSRNDDDDDVPISISSARTEPGSLVGSEHGYVTPTSTSTSSLLSSPVVGAVTLADVDDSVSATSSTPSLPTTTTSLRSPVSFLRETPRGMSSLSISSTIVENGSVAGDDESIAPTIIETAEPEEDSTVLPHSVGKVSEVDLTSAVEGEDEEEKEEKTNAELEQYENEAHDLPVAPESIIAPVIAGHPKEKESVPVVSHPHVEEDSDADAGYGDILDHFTEEEPTSPTAKFGPSGMPLVKCSDCSAEVDIMELSDHICVPNSASSPSLTKALPSPPPRAPADVPTEVLDHPSPSLSHPSPTRSIPARTSPLDSRFNAIRRQSIPVDVEDDLASAGDHWDGETPDSPVDASPHFQSVFEAYNTPSSVDVPEDESEDPLVKDILSRASSNAEAAKREKEARPPVPKGLDDDEEDGGEQVNYGSVTIVRTTLSHHK